MDNMLDVYKRQVYFQGTIIPRLATISPNNRSLKINTTKISFTLALWLVSKALNKLWVTDYVMVNKFPII